MSLGFIAVNTCMGVPIIPNENANEVVTPLPSGAASPSTWAEREREIPQRKDYIINNRTD